MEDRDDMEKQMPMGRYSPSDLDVGCKGAPCCSKYQQCDRLIDSS